MHIFWELLKTDLKLLLKNLKDKVINALVWSGSTCIISGYVLQAFGMPKDFGVFQATSIIVSIIGFQIYTEMFVLLADIEGEKHISYYFTLPISNWLIFIKFAVIYTINGFILSIFTLPLMKIILWHQFDLSQIHITLFLISLIIISIFFAFFTILLTSCAKSISKIEDLIVRFLFPLWFFGGFQSSYKLICKVSPYLAYSTLISPFTYSTEAIRSVSLNPSEFLPLWISLVVLIVMAIISGCLGIAKLKKRLDFI